ILLGLVVAAVLVGLSPALDRALDWLWETFGWARTDAKSFRELIGDSSRTPLGAIVLGITAGLGEELIFRGALQPRLGILISNLFFASAHALQYNWDGVVGVFIIGMVLGLVRKYTNTTTSAIVHGTFDFGLLFLESLNVPGFNNG